MIWYKNNDNDIVISTRIRLARNVEGMPFPNALSDKSELTRKIKEAVINSNSTLSKEFEFINLDDVSIDKKQALAEEHMISFDMLSGNQKSVLISNDKTMSIMLMEEDHIRLQVIENGLCLDEAYETANKIDDVLEENLKFEFDEEWGYLTACPTNAGTGLRASVMMHLPALSLTNNMQRIISSAQNLGITVRGMYGEGSKADGNIYQISNSITEGFSEKEIIEKVKNVVNQICELEEKARENLMKSSDDLSDRVYRAFGTLKYARKISSKEAKSLISDVLLGQKTGIISERGKISPVELMVRCEPALLCGEEKLQPEKRDIKRAEFLRDNIG